MRNVRVCLLVSPVHLANIHASNIELNKSVESYE
jgi:hypothetical protein